MNYSPRRQLSKEDSDELSKAASFFQSDSKIREAAKQYIIQYRNNSQSSIIQKSAGVAKCALFLTEKSQSLFDMKGNRIPGVGLSLNQIIKSYHNIEEFMFILKDFVRKVNLSDPQVEKDLHSTIEKINFSMTFHNKFEKVLKELSFTDRVNQSYNYLQTFSSFVWLLFVDSKAELYKDEQDIVRTTCLLATCFYSMIRYCVDHIKPLFLADITEKIDANKQAITRVIGRITEKIFALFSIQDYETYKMSVSDFDDYFEILLQTNILKNSADKIDFFSPELMHFNYKRLDALYQKRLSANDLDERLFLKDRISTLTPSKITPFEKHRVTIKSLKAARNEKSENVNPNAVAAKNFYSHRTLEYEPEKHLMETKNIIPPNNSQIKEAKFPKNVIFSPSIAKPSLICATPVTLGMEMYNYIIEKPKLVRDTNHSKKCEPLVLSLIQEFAPLKKLPGDSIKEQRAKEMRSNIVMSLYSMATQLYLSQYLNEGNIEQVSKCFLVLSLETVCFVCNVPNSNFQSICENINVDLIVLQRANEFYYRFDKSMPSQLKHHFVEIQTKLIHSQLWKKKHSIETLSLMFQLNDISSSHQQLLKRIFQQIVEQLSKLSVPFKLTEQVLEQIFTVIKCLICFQTALLFNHHLDQLVICSLYAVCKTHKLQVKFNDIKSRYEELNPSSKDQHNDLMCDVYIDDETNEDIIKFYNAVFIPAAKSYIKQPCNDCFEQHNPIFKLKIKEVPPKDVFVNNLKRHRYQNNTSKFSNTRRVIDFQQGKNQRGPNQNQLNKIQECYEEQRKSSLKKETRLLRSGKSNPSFNTIKTEYYGNEYRKEANSRLVNL